MAQGNDLQGKMISETEAIDIAYEFLGIQENKDAFGYLVWRLDQLDKAYWLVMIGSQQSIHTVANVDAASGALLEWANLSEPNTWSLLTPEQVSTFIGDIEVQEMRLVWKPCQASLSPLYPLWEVRITGNIIYVDHQGKIWHELSKGHA